MFMRMGSALPAVATIVAFAQVATIHGQARDATAVLSAARAALGGDTRIAAVKTLIVTGRTRQVRGDNLVPIEFEIQCELPDRYARRDEIPAQDTGPTTTGFNGDRMIQLPRPAAVASRAGGPPPPQQEAALNARAATVKQDFARLMLGLFATSFSSYPLTFTYAAQAEAPQGTADVLDVRGPDSFAARLFIHGQTHLPIMVSWEVRGPAGAAPAEHRLYFADYRDVDGLQLPFRMRRAIGSDTIEETTFDRFRINARVDPRRFEVAN
jgi:hypothetical protein